MKVRTTWIEWAALATTIIGFVILAYFCITPVKSQVSNAQPNQIEINAQVAYGLGYQSNSSLLNYIEPGTTTALFGNATTIFVPPATADQTVNLAALFPNINQAVLWGVQDISNPGQSVSIGTAAGSNKFTLAAGGFLLSRVYGSAPTLYIINSSPNTYSVLKLVCLAN